MKATVLVGFPLRKKTSTEKEENFGFRGFV
jgi:hypothetical protein